MNFEEINNSDLLVKKFGEWPSFHDSEVTDLAISNSDSSVNLKIQVDIPQYDQQKYIRSYSTTLLFKNIQSLKLEQFSNQNVLFDLIFNDISDKQLENINYEIVLDPSCGLYCKFICEKIEIIDLKQKTN